MSQLIEVRVPDIGDYHDVPVIDLCVIVGDVVKVDDALVTLESDKATMDVPSPVAGVVREMRVALGEKVSEGAVVALLEAVEVATTTAATASPAAPAAPPAAAAAAPAAAVATAAAPVEVQVPDIGDYHDVPVIDVCVKVGDTIKVDDPLVTLESDKATMDVPSPVAGVVRAIRVALGDKVSAGSVVALVDPGSPAVAGAAAAAVAAAPAAASVAAAAAPTPVAAVAAPAAAPLPGLALGSRSHASPSVRLLARELGVDLTKVTPSGPKSRILKEDVTAYVKGVLTAPARAAAAAAPLGGGLDLLPWPKVDFAKFGAIEVKPLSRIKKISAQNLARNWVMIPAVTYHEDADITDLEAFRVAINRENEKSGLKITMLAFLIKACAVALKKYPEFNSSLDGDNLVLKQYCHIAFAADTPNGLVVPVIRNADQKSVAELASESGELAKKARDGKLTPGEMSGACFTISSLGGIGGTMFSPIINAPELAILGVNKSVMKPVWNGREFAPRLILPMSLTADHRVIDGAAATRFNVHLARLLADMRRVLL
ncbi:MAG: Dihydrolipoyllysine-residue acetyltransferase component of pyruvate dehydrogenase complex [Accumulibacter sp.]|uniref:dihydrolipoyllysine-residue acetyltransferase n=1 Tax=Accumulibacter sp. TaxID=2053492 RepID=UPI0011F45DAA|nr:dihydrolipoyllysine-residue acetyltransferase [Accumulibacter sp.]TLD44006.1 MAG: Dihydrolipoyllysine-residue acetyltransferase component of pyruvate dehydrogenase complex [Accumulibacter sp.]